jgi:tetratricopeptide (TPR) repeat protein
LRNRILVWYAVAIQSDPSFLGAYHLRGIFWLQMSEAQRMIADFDKVMELNPNEVSLRLEYARSLEMVHLLPEAKRQFELALSYNGLLDKNEPKRLSPDKAAEIEKEMNSLPD